jgi:hypothetical protein
MAKKARNNELQNTTQKTTDRTTRNPQKHEVNSGAPGGLAVPFIICRGLFFDSCFQNSLSLRYTPREKYAGYKKKYDVFYP